MGNRIQVLFVDDEPSILDVTRIFLEKSGEFSVSCSLSAREALETVRIPSFDVIVSDYMMPEMDGIAFLKTVRERFCDIPFILFTGRGREDVVIEALNQGVDFYLQKDGDPKVQFAELVHKIRQAVRRHRAENALREGEKKYRSIIETINDWIWEADLEGNHTFSNSAVERMLGYTADEIIGSNCFSHIHPDDRSRIEDLIAESVSEKLLDQYTTTIRWRHRDGSERLFESAIIPLVNPDGEIIGFRGIDRDITERVRSEEALRESEQRYRLLADNIQDVIWTADLDMRLTYISPSVEALRGISVQEALEEPLSAALTGESFQRLMESRREGLEIAQSDSQLPRKQVMDLEFQCKDGSTVWTEVMINPIIGSDRELSGVIGVMRDINSRKKAEEALRKANRKLSLLSSITRHDINNQLLVVNGFAEQLEEMISDPLQKKYLNHIMTASTRITDIMRFTKEYESIGMKDPIWHDLASTIEDTGKDILPEGVVTRCSLSPGLEIFADPMLGKVFFNLFDNSMKHGGDVSEILVSSRMSGADLVVVFEDDGNGISAGEKEQIFEHAFGRNTGLGLFLVREILSLTGISIRETGEEGVGTRFEITVPEGVWRIAGP